LALAHGDGWRIIHLSSARVLDSTSCPRPAFLSEWFRPPALV
jgi:hypothetical protein